VFDILMLRLRSNKHKLNLGIIDHEFIIDHPVADVAEARFQAIQFSVQLIYLP